MSEQMHHRRQRRFIDKIIQGQLLWGLIFIEILLFTAGMFVIYGDLNLVLQDNMYRVHQEVSGVRALLLKELLLIFPWIIIGNLLLVLIVDRRWKWLVRNIVLQLQDVLYRVKRMDLRVYPVRQTDHEVLQQAKKWLDTERERNARLQSGLNDLPVQDMTDNNADLEHIRECLKNMSQLLPFNQKK